MAKEAVAQIKLYVPAGQANPAPPVGPALGQHGVNIMMFCKSFNDKTKGKDPLPLPVVITVYKDKSFDFIIKTPPTSALIKKSAKLANKTCRSEIRIKERDRVYDRLPLQLSICTAPARQFIKIHKKNLLYRHRINYMTD